MKLIFECISKDTGCICDAVTMTLQQGMAICSLVEKYGLINGQVIELADDDVTRFLPDYFTNRENIDHVTMRYGIGIDELSYSSHNNRELLLMLEKRKPLAFFMDDKDYILDYSYPYEYFRPHVESGEIIKFITDKHPAISRRNSCILLYALPSEEWRIEAFLENMMHINKGHWSSNNELQEGLLLGYTQEQMHEYISYLARLRVKY